jgi:hypothetical protein
MNTAVIREKLHQIINNASDEKLEAIYQLMDTLSSPTKKWWEDENVIREFDGRVEDWLRDEQKSYSMKDI